MKFEVGDCVKIILDGEKYKAGQTASIVRTCESQNSYWIYLFENSRYQGLVYVFNADDAFEKIEKEKVTTEELRKYARGEITHAGLLHYHPLPCAFECYKEERYNYRLEDIYSFLLKYSKKELKPNEIQKWYTFVLCNVYDTYKNVDYTLGKSCNKYEACLLEIYNDLDEMLQCSSEYENVALYYDVKPLLTKMERLIRK